MATVHCPPTAHPLPSPPPSPLPAPLPPPLPNLPGVLSPSFQSCLFSPWSDPLSVPSCTVFLSQSLDLSQNSPSLPLCRSLFPLVSLGTSLLPSSPGTPIPVSLQGATLPSVCGVGPGQRLHTLQPCGRRAEARSRRPPGQASTVAHSRPPPYSKSARTKHRPVLGDRGPWRREKVPRLEHYAPQPQSLVANLH